MLSIFRKLSVLSIALLALVFFGCATVGGGNDFDDNIPTEDEMIEAKCEREGLEMVDQGAVYVTANNNNFKTVTLYFVRDVGGLPIPAVRTLSSHQEVGPQVVHGVHQGDNLFLVFHHVGQKQVWTGRRTPVTIHTDVGGRATLLEINVGTDGVTPFANTSVVPHSFNCLPEED